MFITTNLRLAGGYHLPSAVDVVFGGEKNSEQYFIIYFIFIRERNVNGWRIKNNETHLATKSTNSCEGWNLSQEIKISKDFCLKGYIHG